MPAPMVLTFIGGDIDPSRPQFALDPVMDDLPAGSIPFLFDLLKDFEASHDDIAYVNGAVISDLSDTGDGSMTVASGNIISSGASLGGADFSGLTTNLPGNAVQAPAGVLDAINDGSQYFAVFAYMILPTSGDWNSIGALAPIFQASSGAYTANPDLVTISQKTGGVLSARRQTNGASTVVETTIVLNAAAYGKPALVVFWRNASGIGLRLMTHDTDQTTTGVVGAVNSGDFSLAAPKWGMPAGFWSPAAAAEHVAAANFTLLGGWVENLQVSGRDPVLVANQDWARRYARIAALLE